MTHRNLFRRIAVTAGAAVIGLTAANADAHAFAGNYQDHVLPQTTRHTAEVHHARSAEHYARAAQANSRIEGGNYQDHVVHSGTRRTADAIASQGQAQSHEVAMSSHGAR